MSKVGWQSKTFEDCVDKAVYTQKIQRKDFLDEGTYPIVSQESEFVNGFWNIEVDVFKVATPVIVFGDHTKILKYVDFDFVLGADGVKVLPPKPFLVPKFFYYQLQSVELDSLGYARHYRLLKERSISFPPLPEQHRIVAILDAAFDHIATAKANCEANLLNARAIFRSYLQAIFKNEKWKAIKLHDACEDIFAGGDAPTENFSVEKSEKFTIPIFANAVKRRGLYGYTNFARVTQPSITISARGSGTGHTEIRFESFLPIVRLIVLIPNAAVVNLEFLKYSIDNLEILRSGSAIPQLTVPMIKRYHIPLPSLPEQFGIISKLEIFYAEIRRLEFLYQRKLQALDDLKKSLLNQAFIGAL